MSDAAYSTHIRSVITGHTIWWMCCTQTHTHTCAHTHLSVMKKLYNLIEVLTEKDVRHNCWHLAFSLLCNLANRTESFPLMFAEVKEHIQEHGILDYYFCKNLAQFNIRVPLVFWVKDQADGQQPDIFWPVFLSLHPPHSIPFTWMALLSTATYSIAEKIKDANNSRRTLYM